LLLGVPARLAPFWIGVTLGLEECLLACSEDEWASAIRAGDFLVRELVSHCPFP